MQQSTSPEIERQWWKPWTITGGYRLDCTIGPLCLQIARHNNEWRLGWYYEDEMDASVRCEFELCQGDIETEDRERYSYARADNTLRLRPILLDRPVVIRPREPVFLPGGEEITLYLSTPLCLAIEAGEGAVLLRELPVAQLSDTWFGLTTREGDVCYSGRTHARQRLEEVPQRQHRALTPIRIRNQASSVLPLEKLSLPVPLLSVYAAGDGSFWTQSVSLVRTGNTELAMVEIDEKVPKYVSSAELISPSRQVAERGSLVRAFGYLFNG